MNGMRLFMLAAALLCGLTLAGCSDKDEGELWVPTFRLQYIDTEGHNLLSNDVQGVEITITDEGGTVLSVVQKPEILEGRIAFSIPETFNSNSDRKAEKKRYEISVKIPSLFGPDRVERFTVGGAMAYFMHYDEVTYNGQPMQRQQVQLYNAFDPIRSRPTAVEVSDHGAAALPHHPASAQEEGRPRPFCGLGFVCSIQEDNRGRKDRRRGSGSSSF